MELSATDFDFLRRIVLDDSAIVLEPGKEYLVETRIAPILRREGFSGFRDLTAALRRPGTAELREAVVDAMTTNETSFFRDGHPWDSLRDSILPALIEARSAERRLTFWCAASSSGQEPYSLAMLLHEHFRDIVQRWTVRIVGTDLSTTMVERARAGRFTQLEVNRGLPAKLLVRHFTRVGTEWQINDDIRRIVEFRRHNLIDPTSWGLLPQADGVMMRNVLIYFDDATRRTILDRARGRLRSDGFLLLGSAEMPAASTGLDRVQIGKTLVYSPSTTAAWAAPAAAIA